MNLQASFHSKSSFGALKIEKESFFFEWGFAIYLNALQAKPDPGYRTRPRFLSRHLLRLFKRHNTTRVLEHDPGWFLLAFFKLKLLPKGPLTTLTHITTYIILIKLRLIHKRDSNLFSLINNSKLEGNHKDRYTFTLSKHIARITPTIR